MSRPSAVEPELLRQARSAVEERRPVCPTCGTRAPYLRDPGASAEWFKPHGHRCPHGEPCAGWTRTETLSAYLEACLECSPPKPGTLRLLGGGKDSETEPRVDGRGPKGAKGERGDGLPRADAVPGPGAKPASTTTGGPVAARGKTYTHGGETKTKAEWARDSRVIALGISDKLLSYRLNSGWSIGDALTVPKGQRLGPRKAAKKRKTKPKRNPLPEPAPEKPAEPKTNHRVDVDGMVAGLAVIMAAIESTETELEAMRVTANVLARTAGQPIPFEELEA